MPNELTSADRRVRPIVVALHLIGILVAWGSVWVLARVALGTRTGQWLDEQALRASHARWGEASSRVGRVLREGLDLLPTAAVVVAAIAVLVFIVRSHRIGPAVVGMGTFGAAVASVQILKRWVLDKPDFAIHEVVGNSFPSGHTALAAAAGLVVVLASPARFRPWTAAIASVVSVVAGVGTVVNAWHRPSDVIAALLITVGWGLLGGLLLYVTTGPATTRQSRWLPVLMVIVGGLLVAVSGGFAWLAFTEQVAVTALIAGMLAVAAGSLACWGGTALLLHHR